MSSINALIEHARFVEVGHAVLAGHSFAHEVALANALGPEPRSGRQEWLENLVGRYI